MTTITNHEHLDAIINKDICLIIAKTRTCGVCKNIAPRLEANIPFMHKIDTYEIYADEMEQFRGEYVVFSVPTILIYSKGKELLRESRFINYEKINRLLSRFLD